MKIDIVDINNIIDKEMEFAKQVNLQMAMGMLQIRMLLNKFDDKLEAEANNQN